MLIWIGDPPLLASPGQPGMYGGMSLAWVSGRPARWGLRGGAGAAAATGLQVLGFGDAVAAGWAGSNQAGGVGLGDGVAGGVGVAAHLVRLAGFEYGVGDEEAAGGGVVLAGADGSEVVGWVDGVAEVAAGVGPGSGGGAAGAP